MDFSNPFAFETGEQQFPITSPTWPVTSTDDPLSAHVTSQAGHVTSSRRSRYQSHPGAAREDEEEVVMGTGSSEEGRTRKLSQRQLSQVLGSCL